ncbi:MAG: hypothetical protein HQL93_04655 [Magnetococcales bacterium]|nr:hypothetical protein [Magnetococcales bacterium]
MPIELNQIKFMKSQVVSDTSANGGRISSVEIATGVNDRLEVDIIQRTKEPSFPPELGPEPGNHPLTASPI